MSLELCKELAYSFEEQLHNQKKLELIDDIIAEEFTNSDRGKSGEILTRQSLREQFEEAPVWGRAPAAWWPRRRMLGHHWGGRSSSFCGGLVHRAHAHRRNVAENS